MKLQLALSLSLLAVFAAAPALAVVPGEVSYQGLLLDDTGTPVTASVDLGFELFEAATGGTSVWGESHPDVQVVDGVYDVRLGSTTPLTPELVAGGSLYLEISVDGETLTPRQPLLVVPYALRSAVSENTEQVDGFSADYLTQILENVNLDGAPPSNLDPREGLADADGDGVANFVDPDNDDDGLSDGAEIAQGSDINLVTPTLTSLAPPTVDGFETTSIHVQGTNFASGMAVVFGSETPTPTNLSPTSFDVLVGPQPEGTVDVSVTLPNGESDVIPFDFFFLEPAIESFSPSRFDEGETGTVTVTGQNFISGMTVDFGSQSPTPTNLTATSFDVDVAAEPPGPVSVTVTLPNGKSTTDDTGFEVSVGAPRVIFVTATQQDGNLGGLTGADAICQGLATSAGLEGAFHAWLADSTDSPSTRESRLGAPYVRTDDVTIADDWADLTDGAIAAAISRDQNGLAITGGTAVWSDVAAVGAGLETTKHCGEWTVGTDAEIGRRGDSTATDTTWTELGTGQGCATLLRLYCVEQ